MSSPSPPAIRLVRVPLSGIGRSYLSYETNCPECEMSTGFRLDQVDLAIVLNPHGECPLSNTLLHI